MNVRPNSFGPPRSRKTASYSTSARHHSPNQIPRKSKARYLSRGVSGCLYSDEGVYVGMCRLCGQARARPPVQLAPPGLLLLPTADGRCSDNDFMEQQAVVGTTIQS